MGARITLLIDGDNLVKRGLHATLKGDVKTGIWNGGIYTTLTTLIDILELYRPARVIIVFDKGIPEFRKAMLPSYKANRINKKSILTPDEKTECFRQLPQVCGLLEDLGCSSFQWRNSEADDLVAHLARKCEERGDRVYIVSNDKDLWQCITSRVTIVNPGNYNTVEEDDVFESTGVYLHEYLLYKTLAGDPSDGIAGLKGAGTARARAIVELFREDIEALQPQQQLDRISEIIEDAIEEGHANRLQAHEQRIPEQIEELRKMMTVMDLSSLHYLLGARSFQRMELMCKHSQDRPMTQKELTKAAMAFGLQGVMDNPARFWQPFNDVYKRGNK